MNTLTLLILTLNNALDAGSNRTNEEGSQTTDNLLWVVAVIAIAGLATLALSGYVSGLIGKIG